MQVTYRGLKQRFADYCCTQPEEVRDNSSVWKTSPGLEWHIAC